MNPSRIHKVMLDNFVQVQGARIGASNASKVTGFEREGACGGPPPPRGETLKFQKFAEHPDLFQISTTTKLSSQTVSRDIIKDVFHTISIFYSLTIHSKRLLSTYHTRVVNNSLSIFLTNSFLTNSKHILSESSERQLPPASFQGTHRTFLYAFALIKNHNGFF